MYFDLVFLDVPPTFMTSVPETFATSMPPNITSRHNETATVSSAVGSGLIIGIAVGGAVVFLVCVGFTVW